MYKYKTNVLAAPSHTKGSLKVATAGPSDAKCSTDYWSASSTSEFGSVFTSSYTCFPTL